jgi:hypothetical protein
VLRARLLLVAPALLLLLFLLFLLAHQASAGTFGRVAGNPADRLLSLPIEPERYDHARRCVKHPARGTLALQSWLEQNARGASWGILRCERLSGRDFSLHAEGRAIDWHLDARDASDRRAAARLIALLLAPDRLGNRHALARRMGVQEIIWNCRSWWSGGEGMDRYSACYERDGRRRRISATLAHRDHVHIGLNLPGARMRTSFWQR